MRPTFQILLGLKRLLRQINLACKAETQTERARRLPPKIQATQVLQAAEDEWALGRRTGDTKRRCGLPKALTIIRMRRDQAS